MSQPDQPQRRVVITGIGTVAPEGIGREAFHQSLRSGKSGVGRTTRYLATATPGGVAAEVTDFNDETVKKVYLKSHRKHLKVMGRDVQLGVAAALLAVEDAGLSSGSLDRDRIGVEFGANLMFSFPQDLSHAVSACVEGDDGDFRFERWGSAGLGAMEPLWMLKHLPNMPACHVGIFTDSRGPNNSITQDEVSSTLALKEATDIIRRGDADVMIAGSTGMRVHPLREVHAALWDKLAFDSEHPQRSVRPFDRHAGGDVIGEAGASLILEDEAVARQRGATILGEILGGGSSCVADPDGNADIKTALVNAMRAALRSAKLEPGQIGHINAHGLAIPELDRQEAAAIREVFGERTVPVVGLKGYHGNPGASGGMLEVAQSILSLQDGVIPYTLNCEEPDPDLGLNVVVGEPLPAENRVFLKISYTLIGQASALVVRC